MLGLLHPSSLLSESHAGVYAGAVIARRRIFRYADEGNWLRMPPAWVEAGEEG